MTREQLSKKSLTKKELEVRDNEILRLFATGLYSSWQIANAYNRSTRRMNKIRAENIEPVNPWMTIHESAEFLEVSPSVIHSLINAEHIKATTFPKPENSPGATIKGTPIYLVVRKTWLFDHENRWGSADGAARKAGISKKSMEARARNGTVAHLKAPRGKSFTLYNQTGLRYIYDLSKISPAISEPAEEQLEIPLETEKKEVKHKRELALRVGYQSDLQKNKQTIWCNRELDLTMYHTKGKCSKRSELHFEWDDDTNQPTITIKTRVPVTVLMSTR